MAIKTTIQFRRDALSAWQQVNPTLSAGEIALVDLNNGLSATKNYAIRIGDGTHPFNELPETAYALSSNVAAQIAELEKTITDGLSENSNALTATKQELQEAINTADGNLSAGIGLVKDELTALIDGVEDKVDNKIKVGDTSIDTLTIKRVNIEEYHNILTSETIDNSTLYVVSSDNLNAFGSRVVQVGDAVEDTDAVNFKQLNAVKEDLQGKIDSIGNIAGEGIGKLVSDVNDIISASIPKLEGDISNVATNVSTLSNTTIPALDGKVGGVAAVVNTISSTTIPGLEGEIDTVSSVVNTLTTTTIPEIEEEIDNLETSLSNYNVTVSASADDINRLKSWTFTQGGTEIAKVEVPFDVFVDKGEVVEHDGRTCLELTLKDGSVVHIPVNELVDVYTADNEKSGTIDVSIENFKVSAEVRDGAITTAKLADKAVTAGKIADKTITNAQIADETITGAQISASTIDQSKLTGEFVFDCGGANG